MNEGSSRLGVLSRGPPFSLFDMLTATRGGFRNLMFLIWFAIFGGLSVFLDVGTSILLFVFPFLGALTYLCLVGFHHLISQIILC